MYNTFKHFQKSQNMTNHSNLQRTRLSSERARENFHALETASDGFLYVMLLLIEDGRSLENDSVSVEFVLTLNDDKVRFRYVELQFEWSRRFDGRPRGWRLGTRSRLRDNALINQLPREVNKSVITEQKTTQRQK